MRGKGRFSEQERGPGVTKKPNVRGAAKLAHGHRVELEVVYRLSLAWKASRGDRVRHLPTLGFGSASSGSTGPDTLASRF